MPGHHIFLAYSTCTRVGISGRGTHGFMLSFESANRCWPANPPFMKV